ncbi:MAG: quinol:cytochrome c oxidoreductase quinone-binding subunit 2 [Bacteroidota bacterium]|nr:quinol:cytochrome c oxidoreductase quinone-binding subunit 2 [Bacteroidota bacterium]
MNRYIFESSTKKKILYAFLIGILLFAVGAAKKYFEDKSEFSGNEEAKTEMTKTSESGQEKFTAPATHRVEKKTATEEEYKEGSLGMTILANTYSIFYFGFYIALAAMFFLAATTVAWGGWQVQIQKIFLALAAPIVMFLGLLLVMFIFFRHDLFLWTHDELYKAGSETYDKVLVIKHDFLNMRVFWTFYVIIAGICVSLVGYWWKTLNAIDINPTRQLFSKTRVIGAITIVTTAFIINTFATWLWSMSIQPHWYSTMFTWNTMAGAVEAVLSIILLFIYFLKQKGYLPGVNENHEHDVAKLMFAISIFWTYTWFAQYMLIWYANLPEETEYFRLRRNMDNYGFLFHLAFICNFVLPFLILLTRGAKRTKWISLLSAWIIIFGQSAWFFLMNCPELLPKGGFGLISIGLLFIVGSIFIFVTLKLLEKVKDLASTTHPYVKESYQFKI